MEGTGWGGYWSDGDVTWTSGEWRVSGGAVSLSTNCSTVNDPYPDIAWVGERGGGCITGGMSYANLGTTKGVVPECWVTA